MANQHDRWVHKNDTDQICVKCGDTVSIRANYARHHSGVPDTACSSSVVWTPEYERHSEYTRMPYWDLTRIAVEEAKVGLAPKKN